MRPQNDIWKPHLHQLRTIHWFVHRSKHTKKMVVLNLKDMVTIQQQNNNMNNTHTLMHTLQSLIH